MIGTPSVARRHLPTPPTGEGPVNSLVERRLRRRLALHARAQARVRVPIAPESGEQRNKQPLPRWLRTTLGLLVLLTSAGLHVALVLIGFGIGHFSAPATKPRESMVIEMREHEAKPATVELPEQGPESRPAVDFPHVNKPVTKHRMEPARPKTTAAPLPAKPARSTPLRVLGMSFESTVGEGSGPEFATGNTRMGPTVGQAAKPVPSLGDAGDRGASPNVASTRLPGGVWKPPRKKRAIAPVYPPALKAQGIEGNIPVIVSIDATGKVTAVKIAKQSPYPELNESARQAAMADEFEPATRDGVPVATTIKYDVIFRLTD